MMKVKLKGLVPVTILHKDLVPVVVRRGETVEVSDEYIDAVSDLCRRNKLVCTHRTPDDKAVEAINKYGSSSYASHLLEEDPGGIYRSKMMGEFSPDPGMEKSAERLKPTSLEQALRDVTPDIIYAVAEYAGNNMWASAGELTPALRNIVSSEEGKTDFVEKLCRRGVMSRLMSTIGAKIKMRTDIVRRKEDKNSMVYKMKEDIKSFKLEDDTVRIKRSDLDKLSEGMKSGRDIDRFLVKTDRTILAQDGSTQIVKTYILPSRALMDGYENNMQNAIIESVGITPDELKPGSYGSGNYGDGGY